MRPDANPAWRVSVLRVCFPFVGDSIGGSQKSTLLLLAGLDRASFYPLVVLHKGDGPLATLLRRKAIPYELLQLPVMAGTSPSLPGIFLAQLRNYGILRTFIRDRQIDIVHTNDLRCNLTWGLASRIQARHVWHQRTILSKSLLWRMIGMLTNHVICISETVRDTYKSFAPATTQANPFEEKQFDRVVAKRALVAELNVDAARPVVGYVGRLVSGKGLSDLGELPALLPEVVVVAAGNGPLAETLPATIRRLGFRDPIEPVIAGLDVLIAPSREEGFGRTVVEAMLAGTPVVASDIPAHREASGNGQHAVLVSPGNAQAIANAVRDLLTGGAKTSAFVTSANVFARDRYSKKAHIQAIESIYRGLVSD
jgi:glycosyltransferase involved in cell wall biosynthesis